MSFLDEIGVVILTWDEASNIARTLDALKAFPEIVVVDSGSTDETESIIGGYHNARIVRRPFDNHAAQWNFGLEACGIERPWILALDADYLLPEALTLEMSRLAPPATIAGYRMSFRYCVYGKPLAANLYPPIVALFRRERAHYVQVGHTQRVVVDGGIVDLTQKLDHDDRKPLRRWFASQQKYASLEAEHLLGAAGGSLRASDRIRLMAWPAPVLVFLYTLIAKRCLLDGWPGWFYVMQRTLAELLIALEIVERRLRGKGFGL
jgi:glycosyltransferase involved in cell wall biosynthesis